MKVTAPNELTTLVSDPEFSLVWGARFGHGVGTAAQLPPKGSSPAQPLAHMLLVPHCSSCLCAPDIGSLQPPAPTPDPFTQAETGDRNALPRATVTTTLTWSGQISEHFQKALSN